MVSSSKQRCTEAILGALAIVVCQLGCGEVSEQGPDYPKTVSQPVLPEAGLPSDIAAAAPINTPEPVDATPAGTGTANAMLSPSAAGNAAPAPSGDVPTPPSVTPMQPAPMYTTSYYRDIRPIIENACLDCHVAGGVGPFPLDDWKSVNLVAGAVVQAVATGVMPPWPADEACHSLRDSRALPQEARDVFVRWRDENFPEGKPAEYRPLRAAARPEIGPATLTLDAGKPYTPPANADDYRCFVTSYVFAKDTYVRAIDVLPDQRSEVHHVQVHVMTPEQRTQLELTDFLSAATGYNCNIGLALTQNMFSWRPGGSLVSFDAGDAVYVPAGSSIMLQVHYNTQFLAPGAAPTPDQSKVQLWTLPDGELPDRVIYRQMMLLPLLAVPAGNPHYVVEATIPFSELAVVGPTGKYVPGEIIGMTPHAHQIASQMNATMIAEGTNEQQCLINVPTWDFGWQLDYLYKEGVPYTPGDSVRAACVYDNSPEHQPFIDGVRQQPKRVGFGEASSDEMCLHYVWLRMDRHAFLGQLPSAP
jgi:hypothetical protein